MPHTFLALTTWTHQAADIPQEACAAAKGDTAASEDAVPVAAKARTVDYSGMRCGNLRVELQKRGADSSGSKGELVQRLEDLDSGRPVFNVKKINVAKKEAPPS